MWGSGNALDAVSMWRAAPNFKHTLEPTFNHQILKIFIVEYVHISEWNLKKSKFFFQKALFLKDSVKNFLLRIFINLAPVNPDKSKSRIELE